MDMFNVSERVVWNVILVREKQQQNKLKHIFLINFQLKIPKTQNIKKQYNIFCF